jgi:uncharacterized protein
MRVLIAGASGFLGRHLRAHLTENGNQVTVLVRRPSTSTDEVFWDPDHGILDDSVVTDVDVVINLAGSPTARNPHSGNWAKALLESRVRTTSLLAKAIAESPSKPRYLAGNGISFYGDHGADQVSEETSSVGSAFLTEVTKQWQAAADPAIEAGAQVVFLRTAPVLNRTSAPLKQLLPLFRLGLGAKLGDGSQYFPCISLSDWVRAVDHLLGSTVEGPVNLSCPQPPTQAEFTQELARQVGRRALLSVPSKIIELGAGRLSSEVLGSIRAVPRVLLDSGYEFLAADIRAILKDALGTGVTPE